jgi:hypothetical protein
MRGASETTSGSRRSGAEEKRFIRRHRLTSAATAAVAAFYSLYYLRDLIISGGKGLSLCETGYVLLFATACAIMSVSAAGLVFLKRWAWYGTLAGSALLTSHLLASGFASLFYRNAGDVIVMPFIFMWWMFFYGADPMGPIMLLYLLRPEVKALFSRRISPPADAGEALAEETR